MIRYLKGKVHPQQDGTVIIETASGIGFRVFIPGNSSLYQCEDGEEAEVFTAMTVRETEISLYGFKSQEELELFQLLTTVKGVGSKAGLAVMGIAPLNEIKRALTIEDATLIQRAQGIGKRTADRIILELKDKVEYTPGTEEAAAEVKVSDNQERQTAIDALVALGYSHVEAEDAINQVENESLSSEDYIKAALRNLI